MLSRLTITIAFSIGLCFFIAPVFSQGIVTEIPVHFGQYFNNFHINPAKGGSRASLEFFSGTRRSNDNFVGIATSGITTFIRVNSTEKGFNVVGLDANNDQEGPYLARNRGYVSYSRHQKLNNKCFLSGGISLGFYSFGIKASPSSAAASGNAFDSNTGIYFYTKKTRLGIAVNQVNNADVQPILQIIRLNRLFTFIGEQKIKGGESFTIIPSVYTRYIQSGKNPQIPNFAFGGGANCLLGNMINVGATYEIREGFYGFVGVQNICIACKSDDKSKLSSLNVDFSYFIPTLSKYRANTQTYEVILRYYYGKGAFLKKKEDHSACPDF